MSRLVLQALLLDQLLTNKTYFGKGEDASLEPKQTTLYTCLHEQVTFVFVESCDARNLLGTVTRLFIPAFEHSDWLQYLFLFL